jgi:molecular chaperone DnaK (HSP70)
MNYKPSELANIIFIKGLKALLSSENNTINDNICFIYPESQIHKINISKAITSYFTLLKEEIIDRVDEYSKLHNGHLVDEQKILWIFTIPAFWSEFIKQLLKKSFEEKNIEHFKIIYESEAEALSIYDNEYINSYYKKKDKVFMIIDAGGNSFDISIYEIIDNNGGMKEIKSTISYNFGINKISEEIINIIENIAGKNEIKKVKQNNPGEWIKTLKDIIQAIEKTYILEGNVEIEISSSFSKFIKPNDYNIRGKTFSLLFPSNIIEKITINMLIKFEEKLDNLFENLKKENIYINNVLFTGGFSQNQYFKKRMNNYFDKKRIYYNYITSYQNMIPKGSILFAKDPYKIQSRISPVTIGIKKLTFDDKMEIILKKNELIKNTLSKTIYIQPEKDFQDIIQINIYLTNKDIINEENLLNFYFGRLLLRIENTDKIQITFIYDTHLSFKAKDKEGKEINTEFQFFK